MVIGCKLEKVDRFKTEFEINLANGEMQRMEKGGIDDGSEIFGLSH